VCALSGPDYLKYPASCGKAFPVVEARIVDVETGIELPQGQGNRGELQLKSSLGMLE
jgi:acyl-CoA synthetase (AMP-forming)/AMP-acid ligase II